MKFIKRKNIDTYRPKSQRFSVEVDGRAIINTNKSLTVPIGNDTARPATPVPGMIRYNSQSKDLEVYSDYSSWGWETIRTDRPADIFINTIGDGDGDGTVDSVTILNGGSGYSSPPTLNIGEPDVGTDTATATATVVDGVITEITIVNPGSGYITVPTITIDGANQTASLAVKLTGTLDYALPYIPVNSTGSLSATNIQIYVENVFQLPGINYTVVLTLGVAYVRFDAPVPFGKPIYAIYGYDR